MFSFSSYNFLLNKPSQNLNLINVPNQTIKLKIMQQQHNEIVEKPIPKFKFLSSLPKPQFPHAYFLTTSGHDR